MPRCANCFFLIGFNPALPCNITVYDSKSRTKKLDALVITGIKKKSYFQLSLKVLLEQQIKVNSATEVNGFSMFLFLVFSFSFGWANKTKISLFTMSRCSHFQENLENALKVQLFPSSLLSMKSSEARNA